MSSRTPSLPSLLSLSLGSCVNAGYTGCCECGDCRAEGLLPCYCDRLCHILGDCCDDILDISCTQAPQGIGDGRVLHVTLIVYMQSLLHMLG